MDLETCRGIAENNIFMFTKCALSKKESLAVTTTVHSIDSPGLR